MANPAIRRKWAFHCERAKGMSECIPPWEWINDEGESEFYIFLGESCDGLNALINFCAEQQRLCEPQELA